VEHALLSSVGMAGNSTRNNGVAKAAGDAAETGTEGDLGQRLRTCAADHGLSLHRIHLFPKSRNASLQATIVMDCRCGRRWLVRVAHGEVVAVDGAVLGDLRRGREKQVTAPPGFAGAPSVPPARRRGSAAGRAGQTVDEL
jgi:hypothetical protein